MHSRILSAAMIVGVLMAGVRAEAGLFRRRSAQCPPAGCPTTVTWSYQARGTYQVASDDPQGFLASLNAWRASYGRPPLSWDATLAAFAASNTGVHAPGSSGGASQCWAGVGDLVTALRMWQASPPHSAILMNAQISVGVSRCLTGVTCNAR